MVAATPAALAASVTAMHQSGQTRAVLRLDPPGLGALSVHIAVGQGAQVNVQFIPTQAQTGQLLNAGMDQLRQAMAGAGLQLGQAQVGGGGAQGGGGDPRGSGGQPGTARGAAPVSSAPADAATNGVRAYA
jgi:flagellar hook-length control protein FliK